MAEEILNDTFPDLKEVESKVGRKTPESLLMWMRDAADCEDGRRSGEGAGGGERSSASSDSFSDKISNLKQELRWLRSADVRILRQLVALHEGIEAMRWLMEERGALTSHSSSLTGSLSSLVMVEDQGPSMPPCRESLSPTKDLTETAGLESAHLPPSSFHAEDGRASSSADSLVAAKLQKSQPQDSAGAPLEEIEEGAGTIKRALLRSIKRRRKEKMENGELPVTKQSVETQAEVQAQGSLRASQNNKTEEEKRAPRRETALLVYDTQWCWVESQDDVMFL